MDHARVQLGALIAPRLINEQLQVISWPPAELKLGFGVVQPRGVELRLALDGRQASAGLEVGGGLAVVHLAMGCRVV